MKITITIKDKDKEITRNYEVNDGYPMPDFTAQVEDIIDSIKGIENF
jgi:hypothetical protein